MAGPLSAVAAGASGGQSDVTIAIDGGVHESLAQQVASPVQGPLAGDRVGRAMEVHVQTQDLVLPNPAGSVYRAAEPSLVSLNGRPLFVMNEEAMSVHSPMRTYSVPWYYMMDDSSIRPYHVLFWDTGTEWYLSWGEDFWTAYAGAFAPGAEKAGPFGVARGALPSVQFQTQVDEIDLAASLDVLLHSGLEAARGVAFLRPDAPSPAEGAFAPPADAPVAAAIQVGPAPGAAVASLASGPAGVSPLGASGPIAPAPLVDGRSVAAATMGAVGVVALAAYHLIRKSAILKNKVRSTIAEHVLRQPGSTITEIAQAVGVTHQTASYHLRLLQEHGLVLGVERGNKRLYFRNDGSFNQEERKYVAVLRDAESMRVLNLIRNNPWIMKNEAAAALGVSRNTLNWHLQKLVAAGLVSEARENGYCFLFCNRKASDDLLGTVAQKVEDRRVDAPMPDPAGVNSGTTAVPPGLFVAPPAAERQPL